MSNAHDASIGMQLSLVSRRMNREDFVKRIEIAAQRDHFDHIRELYDLTTLQREANRLFGYTAKQTLDYAQSLYEKKLLTYPRTDSRYLTSDMAETASCVIHLAAKLPPFDGCTNFFPLVETMISDKDVSDHHAIIPTMEIEKADIKGLPLGERNLFLLVCCKLLCASAEPYMYEAVTATFDCGGYSFTAKGKRILSEGWREIDCIFRTSLKEKPADGDGDALPDFTKGQTFGGAEVAVTEHFTDHRPKKVLRRKAEHHPRP